MVDRSAVDLFPSVFDPAPAEAHDDQKRRHSSREEVQDDEGIEEDTP